MSSWGSRAKRSAGRSPQARAESDRSHRPRRFRVRLSQGTLRRHAPACRLRAGAGRPPQYSPDGRAFFGARRADRRNPADRSPRPLGRGTHADQEHPHGHPQHRGGGADVRPHHRVLSAIPAASPPKFRSSSSIRATGSTRVPSIGGQDLRAHDQTAGGGRPRDGLSRPWLRDGFAASLDQYALPA